MIGPHTLAEACAALAGTEPAMARLVERLPPPDPERPRAASPFAGLLRAIVFQQLAGKAAATIHGRVLALLPDPGAPQPGAILALAEEDLRGAGLSRNKLAAVRDLAAKTLDGTVPASRALAEMDDEAVIERLVTIRGIGRWTAEMLLIFDLGRPDVLPLDDLGVRKGYRIAYATEELPSRRALAAHGERWRPHRSLASWYLWRASEAPEQLAVRTDET